MDLSPFLKRNALVLIFAPSFKDPRFIKQEIAFKKERANFIQKSLVRIEAFAHSGKIDGKPLAEGNAETLREKFEIEIDDFAIVIISKEGRTKLNSARPISTVDLYKLV